MKIWKVEQKIWKLLTTAEAGLKLHNKSRKMLKEEQDNLRLLGSNSRTETLENNRRKMSKVTTER